MVRTKEKHNKVQEDHDRWERNDEKLVGNGMDYQKVKIFADQIHYHGKRDYGKDLGNYGTYDLYIHDQCPNF